MPVGIMHQMWAGSSCTNEELLAQADADVHLADDLGFDSIMFGEHHFVRHDRPFYGRIPVPELLIAGLAATTNSIKLGTGVKVLALDSAWRSAETLLLLDLLSEGRAFFCLGQGTIADATFPPGTTDEQRRALFRDRLTALLGFLRRSDDAGLPPLNPPPVRDVTKRVWVAARDEASIDLAAREGLHFVVGQAEHGLVQREYVQRYRASGGRGQTRGVRIVCVADTDHAALEEASFAVRGYFGAMSKGPYYQKAVRLGVIPSGEPASAEQAMTWLSFCVGSPDTVARQLEDYLDTAGVDRLDVMFHLPDLNPAGVQRSMRLFAREVMPVFETTSPSPAETGVDVSAGSGAR